MASFMVDKYARDFYMVNFQLVGAYQLYSMQIRSAFNKESNGIQLYMYEA